MTPSPAWFGPRLRELREAAGFSQAELARRTSLAQSSIAAWEQGHNVPLWSAILTLASVLGVTCEAFAAEPADTAARPRGRPKKSE